MPWLLTGHFIIGLASMFACACMVLACAAQLRDLLETARRLKAPRHPWEIHIPVQPARPARNSWHTSARAPVFAP